MEIRQLFADDDAVSPVIGVILMVAITVILAAVIGTFVLGLGDQVSDSAPQANFNFDFAGGSEMTVTHEGGDGLSDSDLSVSVEGTTIYTGAGTTGAGDKAAPNDFAADWQASGGSDNWGSTVGAGDSLTAIDTTGTNHGGQEVRVIWSSSSGGDSATIGKATWPN